VDFFSYQVTDPFGRTDTAQVLVNVVSVNDAPVAVDDGVQTDQGQSVFVPNPAANDTDADGDTLTVLSVGGTSLGTLTPQDGGYLFQPHPDAFGEDQVAYTVTDGQDTDMGVIDIRVNGRPGSPPISASGLCCLPVEVDVLASASDPDGDLDLTYLGVTQQDPNGTATVKLDTSGRPYLEYQPDITAPSPWGAKTVTVRVRDNDGLESLDIPVTVNVGVIVGGVLINEVVPAEGKVELVSIATNAFVLKGSLLNGYEIGSSPSQESYSGGSAESFGPQGRVVVDLPGPIGGGVTLKNAAGATLDSVDTADGCYAGSGQGYPSLSRSPDAGTGSPCNLFQWVDPDSLGAANP
jgi:hypothetical protein